MEPINVSQLGSPPTWQPQQPIQPPQPPPSNNFSSEPSMNQNAGVEELIKVVIHLDKESIRIIREASGIHAESIINTGIKMFAKTNIYKEFMLKPDFQVVDNSTEDIVSLAAVTFNGAPNGIVNAKPSAPQAIFGETGNASSNTGIKPVASW